MIEVPKSLESKIQRPPIAYLFDVDGTLTDPGSKQVRTPELLDQLRQRLTLGRPLGFNTGRSLEFVTEQILDPLEMKIEDKRLLRNIVVIGEKGGVSITYDEKGNRNIFVDTTLNAPVEVQDEVRSLVAMPPYSETMFYDSTKKTMISVELLPAEKMRGRSFGDFQASQKELVKGLQELLIRRGLGNAYKIDSTRIATDLENIHAGKALGARQFVKILEERGIQPQSFIGFGDSGSDYGMFEELKRLGQRSRFVFVGDRKDLAGKDTQDVIFTGSIDTGVLEFLRNEEQ